MTRTPARVAPRLLTKAEAAASKRVIFGWNAPPIKEQFPEIDAETAAHFDKDNEAMIRLHIRGFLTDSQRNAAMKKITHQVFKAASKGEQ